MRRHGRQSAPIAVLSAFALVWPLHAPGHAAAARRSSEVIQTGAATTSKTPPPQATSTPKPTPTPQGAKPSTASPAATPTAKPPATTGAKPAATTTTSAKPASATAQPAEPGWPRTYVLDVGTVVIHQPQIASWDDQKKMIAWSAVAYTPKGASTATMGTIKIEAKTKVSSQERLVSFKDFQITDSAFSTMKPEDSKTIVKAIESSIPDDDRVIALDRVMASIDVSAIKPRNTPGVKADPPKIFTSSTPAILVNIDGDVVWSPIKDNELKYLVNTNWDLFEHTAYKTYYLRVEQSWLKAPALEGPWTPATDLPAVFKQLPANDNWADVLKSLPGKPFTTGQRPKVFVSTAPAEMILTMGAPVYQAVKGTKLQWVSNTDSDVFRNGKDGDFYYVITGRWFKAPSLDGPWTFATLELPADFKDIPLEHPRSRVLAAVPGTDEANEAIVLASIPETARISKKELKAPDVAYQGEPQYQVIDPTKVSRAVNTDKDILKADDWYYMCFQAVWFVSSTPNGPWEVATSIPKEIYEIPASSPAHHVTYVTVEADDDDTDEWVTFAYVAGYTGMMVAYGCVVWGSGWYYPPYIGWGGYYPGYYPYPRTYGMGAWYNPWTGAYGRAAGVYGPYGGVTAAARYNPRTGTYSRGAAAYGPYGGRAAAQAYNPRTGTYASTRQGSNVYGNWGSSYVQRGDDWARTAHTQNRVTGNTNAGIQTSRGGGAISHTGDAGRTTVGRTGGGDVYAGHDGNVYRKGSDGSWQQWNNGGWESGSGNRPTPNTGASPDGSDSSWCERRYERARRHEQHQSTRTRSRGTFYGHEPHDPVEHVSEVTERLARQHVRRRHASRWWRSPVVHNSIDVTRRHYMKVRSGIAIAGALLLPVVLLAQSVTRDWDKKYDFATVKTYAIKIGTSWGNQLSENRVINDLSEAITERGWKKVESEAAANVVVVVHGATSTKHELNTFYSGMGGNGYGYRGMGGMGMATGTTTVSEYTVGTLVVDIFDTKTKNLFIRGTASDEINKDPKKNEKKLDKAAQKLFKDFPQKDKK